MKRFDVCVYAFAITNNHVHVVAHTDDLASIPRMMHLAAGSTAKQYNLRKGHLDSLWEHPYQCTLVHGQKHLMNCLAYVDLNMVRAGAVKHPSQWRWCGYDELTGKRSRYRIINQERLLDELGFVLNTRFRGLNGVLRAKNQCFLTISSYVLTVCRREASNCKQNMGLKCGLRRCTIKTNESYITD